MSYTVHLIIHDYPGFGDHDVGAKDEVNCRCERECEAGGVGYSYVGCSVPNTDSNV